MSEGAGEVNMLQSLLSLQLPPTQNPFNKVRGIFFEVFIRLYIVSICILHVYVYIYIFIMWLYNTAKSEKPCLPY